PTIPNDIGSSSSPTKFPASSTDHFVIERYCPVLAAYAWAPASTARQSFPVAIITGSIPFIIPLLCVTARYGSESADSLSNKTPSRTSSPLNLSVSTKHCRIKHVCLDHLYCL